MSLPSVRDHIPLEQGLRRITFFIINSFTVCQRPYSIRTRIKTIAKFAANADSVVRDHIPLEQGLRREIMHSVSQTQSGQRPYSIRTRIKTD